MSFQFIRVEGTPSSDEILAEGNAGTTETRRFWMEPFFATLSYELELQRINGTRGIWKSSSPVIP